MRDGDGRIVGIKKRRMDDATKMTIKGGHEGLFTPAVTSDAPALFVVEGPTDAAAALVALGRNRVVGRPSCTGATRHLIRWLERHSYGAVILVCDADQSGRVGARKCAAQLCLTHRDVRVAEPPAKDVRAFLAMSGPATVREWLENASRAAERVHMSLGFRMKDGQ